MSNDSIFNAVIVMMLITSIAGPILTAKFGRELSIPEAEDLTNNDRFQAGLSPTNSTFLDDDIATELIQSDSENIPHHPLFKVIVPVANPNTEKYLLEMSALIARQESGLVVPLSIAKAYAQMDDPQLKETIKKSRFRLKTVLNVTKEFDVPAKPIIRIDDDIVHGITRTAREQNASLIVMGWSKTNPLQSRLFGSVTDNVFWSSHCPVAVVRLLRQPIDIHRILVPVKDLSSQTLRTISFAKIFAEANQASITLLHIGDRQSNAMTIQGFESRLQQIIQRKIQPEIPMTTQFLRRDDAAITIVRKANDYDMVVLRSTRRRTAGGLAVSEIGDRVIKSVKCSIVLFGEPHS